MKLRKLIAISAMTVAALVPASSAAAGSVTVSDPYVTQCDYTVGWYLNAQDPKNTNAWTEGYCWG